MPPAERSQGGSARITSAKMLNRRGQHGTAPGRQREDNEQRQQGLPGKQREQRQQQQQQQRQQWQQSRGNRDQQGSKARATGPPLPHGFLASSNGGVTPSAAFLERLEGAVASGDWRQVQAFSNGIMNSSGYEEGELQPAHIRALAAATARALRRGAVAALHDMTEEQRRQLAAGSPWRRPWWDARVVVRPLRVLQAVEVQQSRAKVLQDTEQAVTVEGEEEERKGPVARRHGHGQPGTAAGQRPAPPPEADQVWIFFRHLGRTAAASGQVDALTAASLVNCAADIGLVLGKDSPLGE
jgi:hypothetical protein